MYTPLCFVAHILDVLPCHVVNFLMLQRGGGVQPGQLTQPPCTVRRLGHLFVCVLFNDAVDQSVDDRLMNEWNGNERADRKHSK